MNVLVLGRGSHAGAWKIRGVQLGNAIGATVVNGGLQNMNLVGIDLIVFVKRQLPEDVRRIQQAGIPIVWDIVDSWPQPIGNWWVKEAALHWLRGEIKRIQPKGIVATTQVMAKDCTKHGIPVLVLPHHARPTQARTPIRDQITTVGYEGSEIYLGHWTDKIRAICKQRSWAFRTNPPTLAELDVVVAMREQDGYAVRHWKSNIKLANAQGSGTPCVLNREAGYLETASGAELWADSTGELEVAFEQLHTENGARLDRAERLYASTPRLPDIAARYKEWLHAL